MRGSPRFNGCPVGLRVVTTDQLRQIRRLLFDRTRQGARPTSSATSSKCVMPREALVTMAAVPLSSPFAPADAGAQGVACIASRFWVTACAGTNGSDFAFWRSEPIDKPSHGRSGATVDCPAAAKARKVLPMAVLTVSTRTPDAAGRIIIAVGIASLAPGVVRIALHHGARFIGDDSDRAKMVVVEIAVETVWSLLSVRTPIIDWHTLTY